MSRAPWLGVALVLLLATYPLTVLGSARDSDTLLWLGLAALAAGGLIPPILHFVARDPQDDDDESARGNAKEQR